MKKIMFFLFLLTLFSSCREKSNLENEVIAIHDEVMPKMGDIHSAKKELRKIIKKGESKNIEPKILEMIANLEKADEAMMDWMHNWKVPAEDPEKTAYLLKEKDKITKVKEDMNSSLKAANIFLSIWKNK